MPIRDYGQLIDRGYIAGQLVTLDDAQLWGYMNGTQPNPTNPGGILFFGLGAISLGNASLPGGGVLNAAIAQQLSAPIPPSSVPVMPTNYSFTGKLGTTGSVIIPVANDGKSAPGTPTGTPTGITPRFEGIVYATNTFETKAAYSKDVASGLIGVPRGQMASVIKKGVAAVWVDSAVNRGDGVAMRLTMSGVPAYAPPTSQIPAPVATNLSGIPNNPNYLPPSQSIQQSMLPPVAPPVMPGCFRGASSATTGTTSATTPTPPAFDAANFLLVPNAVFINSAPAPAAGTMAIAYVNIFSL